VSANYQICIQGEMTADDMDGLPSDTEGMDIESCLEMRAQRQKISMRLLRPSATAKDLDAIEAKCKTEEALKVFSSNVVKRLADKEPTDATTPAPTP
jgi:hypothetical protein